ncbi:MAG: hypothetical protein AA908_11990 [Chlorobi bacterium NICIL-2]|nr:MAG: hypothetical protein AA908_11990 [Chlorobi bacterium NICIL-2]
MMRRLTGEFGMGKKSKYAESVVDGNYHDAFLCEAGAVITPFRTIAGHEAATVKIYQHRIGCFPRISRRPHVQVQTIFTGGIGSEAHVAEDAFLHGSVTETRAYADTPPGLYRLRSFPA